MKINNREYDLSTFPTHFIHPNDIRIIHHGIASPDRCIHAMIEVMDYVQDRFSLDLMLVPTIYEEYFEKILDMAKSRKRVRVIPPVEFDAIIPFTRQYDIGFFLVPPTTFNLKMCLPNKFFEYIQARLAIAIGPSPEMMRYVKQYELGVVADDFSPQCMAQTLNLLSKKDIQRYKENAHKTAKILNAETEGKKLLRVIDEIT